MKKISYQVPEMEIVSPKRSEQEWDEILEKIRTASDPAAQAKESFFEMKCS